MIFQSVISAGIDVMQHVLDAMPHRSGSPDFLRWISLPGGQTLDCARSRFGLHPLGSRGEFSYIGNDRAIGRKLSPFCRQNRHAHKEQSRCHIFNRVAAEVAVQKFRPAAEAFCDGRSDQIKHNRDSDPQKRADTGHGFPVKFRGDDG